MSTVSKKRKLDEDALQAPPNKKLKIPELDELITDNKNENKTEKSDVTVEKIEHVYMVMYRYIYGYTDPPNQLAQLIGTFDSLKEANKCAKATFCEKIDCWDPLYDGRISNDEFSDIGEDNPLYEDGYTKTELADVDDSEWNDTGGTRKRVWVIEQEIQQKFDKEDHSNNVDLTIV
eukprot:232314_1